MAEKFSDNILRMIAADVHALLGLTAAREMYGKSYFALGIGEKAAVDQAVTGLVGANYQTITPAFLADQEARQPMGFRAPIEPQA